MKKSLKFLLVLFTILGTVYIIYFVKTSEVSNTNSKSNTNPESNTNIYKAFTVLPESNSNTMYEIVRTYNFGTMKHKNISNWIFSYKNKKLRLLTKSGAIIEEFDEIIVFATDTTNLTTYFDVYLNVKNSKWTIKQAQRPVNDLVCCEAFIAECLACKTGMTVDQYCKMNLGKYDCPDRNYWSPLETGWYNIPCRDVNLHVYWIQKNANNEFGGEATVPYTSFLITCMALGCEAPGPEKNTWQYFPIGMLYARKNDEDKILQFSLDSSFSTPLELTRNCDYKKWYSSVRPVPFPVTVPQPMPSPAQPPDAEFCKKNPFAPGCRKPELHVCCLAFMATCLACQSGMTVDQYCKMNPGKYDCPDLVT